MLTADIQIAHSCKHILGRATRERKKNTKTHGHNGDGETSEDEDDKDEQGRRQM